MAGIAEDKRIVACSYEDRESNIVGLKVLAATLRKHAPGIRLKIATPLESPDLAQWIQGREGVELIPVPEGAGSGWDVKPALLAHLLDEGYERVIWLDADIAIARDISTFLPSDPAVLVGTEPVPFAPDKDSAIGTHALGLRVGRRVPIINSCFLHVSAMHRSLLEAWEEHSRNDQYLAAQRRPGTERPPHFVGGQDILRAVLGSEEFAHVRVHRLRCGRDVAHCLGVRTYRVRDQLANLGRGLPPLVHAQGKRKPWSPLASAGCELWPYSYAAREVAGELLEKERHWLRIRSLKRRIFYYATAGRPNLGSLPATAMASLAGKRGNEAVAGRKRVPSLRGVMRTGPSARQG